MKEGLVFYKHGSRIMDRGGRIIILRIDLINAGTISREQRVKLINYGISIMKCGIRIKNYGLGHYKLGILYINNRRPPF